VLSKPHDTVKYFSGAYWIKEKRTELFTGTGDSSSELAVSS